MIDRHARLASVFITPVSSSAAKLPNLLPGFFNLFLQREFLRGIGGGGFLLGVPNLNPDGVAYGHWRNNMAGIDLNRDWGPFTQPETQAVRDELRRLKNDSSASVRLFLDFHSMYHDVFYTQADNAPTAPADFTRAWLQGIQRRFPDYEVRRDAVHDEVTTSKSSAHRTFGIPAITYEFGDETNRPQIRRIARGAAEEMMRLLCKDTTPATTTSTTLVPNRPVALSSTVDDLPKLRSSVV